MARRGSLEQVSAEAAADAPEAVIDRLMRRFAEPGHPLRGRLRQAGPRGARAGNAAAKKVQAELAAIQGDIALLLLAYEALQARGEQPSRRPEAALGLVARDPGTA